MDLISWCNRMIKISFVLLFGLVPFLVTPWNYELFEYNKMMAVYSLTVVIAGSWLMQSTALKQFRIAKTPLDIPIALFLISQLVSTVFSMDPHVSWFGYYSRFNGGLWSVISYVILYYAFVSNFEVFRQTPYISKKPLSKTQQYSNIAILLRVMVTSATIVAIYGVLERLGIDKHLWVQDVQNRVFSTLGQPNWLAAYLTALTPLTWYFSLKSQASRATHQGNSKSFVMWTIVFVLFFMVLLFTRSRSGLLAFAIADIVFWSLLWLKAQHRKNLRLPLIIYHFLLLTVIFINGTNIASLDRWITFHGWKDRILPKTATPAPLAVGGPALESGGTESGTIRKYVWQGAVNAWKSSPKTLLIGTGTETFAFAFYRFRPVGHNMTSEWDFLYNKAHNEYLNYLATTGIFGLGSYLFLIGSFMFWLVTFLILNSQFSMNISNFKFQIGKKERLTDKNLILHLALFSGWLSLLLTNFFGFSVVVVQVFFFLFPAFLFAQQPDTHSVWTKPLRLPTWTVWIAAFSTLVFLVLLASHWVADTRYATGYRYNRAANYPTAVSQLTAAVRLNPTEPVYHDELATAYAGLTVDMIKTGDATAAAQFAKKSLTESDAALASSANNINFWKSRTKIFHTFSAFDPQFNLAAISALEKTRELSPNDPKILYNLALLHARAGNSQLSLELLQKAIELKSDYRDAYWALSIFYTEAKKPDAARQILEQYLSTVNPLDEEFRAKLGQ